MYLGRKRQVKQTWLFELSVEHKTEMDVRGAMQTILGLFALDKEAFLKALLKEMAQFPSALAEIVFRVRVLVFKDKSFLITILQPEVCAFLIVAAKRYGAAKKRYTRVVLYKIACLAVSKYQAYVRGQPKEKVLLQVYNSYRELYKQYVVLCEVVRKTRAWY